MMKLYTILDENDFVVNAIFSEEKPENSVEELMTEKLIKPKFNLDSRRYYEGASAEEKQAEIDKINIFYTNIISELVSPFVEKSFLDGVPIPQHILDRRNELRQECNLKIKEIDPDKEMLKNNPLNTISK